MFLELLASSRETSVSKGHNQSKLCEHLQKSSSVPTFNATVIIGWTGGQPWPCSCFVVSCGAMTSKNFIWSKIAFHVEQVSSKKHGQIFMGSKIAPHEIICSSDNVHGVREKYHVCPYYHDFVQQTNLWVHNNWRRWSWSFLCLPIHLQGRRVPWVRWWYTL